MNTLLLALVIAPQSQELKLGAGAWMHVKPRLPVSAEWKKEREAAEAHVRRLRLLKGEELRSALQAEARRAAGLEPDPKVAYRAGHVFLAFQEDVREFARKKRWISESGALAGAFAQTRGATDAEFIRLGYVVRSKSTSPGWWKAGLGRTLMKLFPDDMLLKEAFVYECMNTTRVTEEELRHAYEMVPQYRTRTLSDLDVLRRRVNLAQNIYEKTKSKDDLKHAIRMYEEYLQKETEPEGRRIGQMLLDILRKKDNE